MTHEPARGEHGESGQPMEPPFVGALLRLCWQRARGHMHEAVRAAGFIDLQEAHFAVFSYPLPNAVRPSDLARQLCMSRQATNYLLGQLEQLGYLERRAMPGSDRRLVYLTKRGWSVAETIYMALRQLQEQWADEVGHGRFDDFMEVLRSLSAPGRQSRGTR
jgi:DNA-binding MarR family transcriptional regulator